MCGNNPAAVMPKVRFKISPANYSGRPDLKWMVSGTIPGGKRVRKFFQSKGEAQRCKLDLEAEATNIGFRAMDLPPDIRLQAAEGMQTLSPFGKNIADAVAFYAEHLERLRDESSVTVADAVEQMMDTKELAGLADRYLRDLRQRCEAFAKKFGKRPCSSITAEEIRRWLASLKLSAVSKNNYKRNINVLFAFAQGEGFCRENPAAKVDFIKTSQEAPGVVRVDVMPAILRHAKEHHADIMAAFCIQAFAGLRTAEVMRLQWENVRLEDRVIEVNAAASKNNVRRPVHIEESLAEWLLMYRRPAGRVAPSCYEPCLAETRREMLAHAPPAEMPHNCLRHSFGTYYCARSGSTHATADQMGNSPAVVKSHYRAVASKRDAEKWFTLTPASIHAKAESVSFAQSQSKPTKRKAK